MIWKIVSARKCAVGRLLLPHPVVTPVALPAGQSALAELKIEPVAVIEQAAAAEVADGQIDFVARAATDIADRLSERARDIFHIHPDGKRRIIRQCRGEGWRTRSTRGRQLLG